MSRSIPRNGETMEQCLARRRAEWANGADVANADRRQNYQARKDELNRIRREREAANRMKVRQRLRESYARNAPARRQAAIHQHYKRKLRVPGWSETEAIAEFYRNCPPGCEVDHIIPLLGRVVSGLHVLGNLQYLSIADNRAKKNHYEVQ